MKTLISLLSKVKITTPVGAGASAATLTAVALGLLNGWHWYATQSTAVQSAVQAVVSGIVVYLAGWWNVVRQHGQTTTLSLTNSVLPTVQVATPPAAGTSQGPVPDAVVTEPAPVVAPPEPGVSPSTPSGSGHSQAG